MRTLLTTGIRAAGLALLLLPLAALLPGCSEKGDSGQFFHLLQPPVGVVVTESGGSTFVVEGGITDTYTLVLRSLPQDDVTVTITPDAQVSVSTTTVTFTTADWDVPRTITVTAVDDGVVEAIPHTGFITHTVTSADTDYDGIAVASVTVSIIDNDHPPGCTIVESDGTTVVMEGGMNDTYTVVLDSPPSADVTVTLVPDAQVTVSPPTLTFTPANWYLPQTVTVGAVDDAVREYSHTGTVGHTLTSGDAGYNFAGPTVTVTILDNDGCPISGTITYTNRIYNRTSGFTGATEPLPIRHAEYEIVQSPSTVLASGVTDASGAYTADLFASGTVSLFVRVYARRRDSTSGVPSAIEAAVVDNGTPAAVYTAASTPSSITLTGPLTLDMTVPLASSGPFNIFDVTSISQEYLFAIDGAANPPYLAVYWSIGSADGTYFSPLDNTIHLLNQTDDTDEFDDDIILHEIGHYVAENYSKDDSPGGPHTLTGHYDIRLTWSEGWATFFMAAVKYWANTNIAPAGRYPEYYWYVDTFGGTHMADEIATPSFPAQTIGADNEGAISAVLWDIAVGAADGGMLNLGYDEIWNVVDNLLTGRAEVSLEDFFDEWNGQGYAPLDAVLAGRTIRYYPDAREANDTSGTATAVPGPTTYATQTFFRSGGNPVGDQNWFRINLTAGSNYTFATSNLGDGADTYLRLYDGSVALIDENDDSGSLASSISFTPTMSGTYYIMVAPYSGETAGFPQIATYGSYDLTISGP